jgi:hypothetical protein
MSCRPLGARGTQASTTSSPRAAPAVMRGDGLAGYAGICRTAKRQAACAQSMTGSIGREFFYGWLKKILPRRRIVDTVYQIRQMWATAAPSTPQTGPTVKTSLPVHAALTTTSYRGLAPHVRPGTHIDSRDPFPALRFPFLLNRFVRRTAPFLPFWTRELPVSRPSSGTPSPQENLRHLQGARTILQAPDSLLPCPVIQSSGTISFRRTAIRGARPQVPIARTGGRHAVCSPSTTVSSRATGRQEVTASPLQDATSVRLSWTSGRIDSWKRAKALRTPRMDAPEASSSLSGPWAEDARPFSGRPETDVLEGFAPAVPLRPAHCPAGLPQWSTLGD